ncbi:MAG: phosphoribosylglycinamide formyltransferase [Oscillospiraceae bacterium]
MLNIAVFVSGGGTNLQALLDAQAKGEIKNGKISLVMGSKNGIYALERAKNAGVKTAVVEKKTFENAEMFETALCNVLEENNIGLIVLAGYLTILSSSFTAKYKRKIINVHPSLIPSFCGEGFYGLKVHEAALAKGVKVTGATVHFVNEVPDGGEIILQKAVEVLPNDTAETLQKRVMENAEWSLLPKAVSLFCEGKLEK